MSVDPTVEARFEQVRDALTDEELTRLERVRVLGNAATYGHDLVAAAQQGVHRKLDACFDQAESWLKRDLYFRPGDIDAAKAFYHLLCRLVRWGEGRGLSSEEMLRSVTIVRTTLERKVARG